MTNLEPLIKLFENHALSLVALILIVFWLYPKLDEVWNLLMKLANPVKQSDDEAARKLREKLEKSDIMDEKIMSALRAVLIEFRASRAYIFSYHNGGENVLGCSFSRVSCTHEVVALGIVPQVTWLQNMPKTLVHAFTRMIDSGIGVFCPCIEECFKETDTSTYQTLLKQGINSCYCVGLNSEARVPIGFLGIDFCSEKVVLSEAQFEKLKIISERVATIFCLSGHKLCGVRPTDGLEKIIPFSQN